jgi:phenylpyruvate tautomerase PptA (4-oxalocrotonate tautomerase family)
MPFYQCQTPEGLLDEAKRAKLANEITRIHCEMTGAPRMFVHVAFVEAKRGTCYSGGEFSKVSFVFANWRAGRPIELKQTFLKTVAEMWARETRTDVKDVLVSISELPAENAMEFGQILPPPNQEKEWLTQHGFTEAPA